MNCLFLSVQVQLKILDVAHNKISTIENIEHLDNLEEFWVSINKINKIKQNIFVVIIATDMYNAKRLK